MSKGGLGALVFALSLSSFTFVASFSVSSTLSLSSRSPHSSCSRPLAIFMKKSSMASAPELPVATLPAGAERPKLIVFDLDNTMWTPELYQLKRTPKADRDIYLFPGTKAALHELATLPEWRETAVAFASRTNKVTWAEDLITRFEVADGVTMASLAKYKEIYPGSKRKHFENLKRDSGPYPPGSPYEPPKHSCCINSFQVLCLVPQTTISAWISQAFLFQT